MSGATAAASTGSVAGVTMRIPRFGKAYCNGLSK